jgi:hypothetical protein
LQSFGFKSDNFVDAEIVKGSEEINSFDGEQRELTLRSDNTTGIEGESGGGEHELGGCNINCVGEDDLDDTK